MHISTQIIRLPKLYALRISRGIRYYSQNIFLFLSRDNHTGIGECDPGNFGLEENSIINSQKILEDFIKNINLEKLSISEVWQSAHEANLAKPLQAALDIALWDLLGKESHKSCYNLFGLSPQAVPTSITVGILELDQIASRVEELLAHNKFKYLKIKLGSPDGIERDKDAFINIQKAAKKFGVTLRVDANGGWSLADAKNMCSWLAENHVEYVEQPLSSNYDDALPELYKTRRLPIFVDESCHLSEDIVRLSSCIDGINIKLMKCGGLTEALRMVAVARAHKLKTMIGCMSESSVSIAAAASIGSLFDYTDLDSWINLNPDPATGLSLVNCSVMPNKAFGHGASLC